MGMNLPEPVLNRLLLVFSEDQAIERVLLFGSRARGDHRPNSDIDLALIGDNIRPSSLLKIQEAVGLYKVDVLDLQAQLEEGFLEEIDKDSVILYKR